MKTVDIDKILEKLKEEKQILYEQQAGIYGKFAMIDKLIQYYSELKQEGDEVSK